jgi:hypothetical protein
LKLVSLREQKQLQPSQKSGQLHKDFHDKFFSLAEGPETPILLYYGTGNRTDMLGNALINQVGLTNEYHLTYPKLFSHGSICDLYGSNCSS